jgi:putative tryptophan/tyrosine transport system substrate-binding protein
MKRREFIELLGGVAATAWPLAARAQRPAKPVIGFLGSAPPATFASRIEGFRLGLRDFGYVEGTNITIEYRFAEGHYERLSGLAAEFVRSKVDLIVTHGTPGTIAAKRATTTIPIVIASIGDPVATGVVASLARPGGNITGQSFFNPELRAKRIELLKEVMPALTQVAVILNADNPAAVGPELQAVQTAAHQLNIRLQPYRLREPSELVGAFEKMEQTRTEAVETGDDPLALGNLGAIVALAARAVPSLDRSGGDPTGRRYAWLRSRYCCSLSSRGLLRGQDSQGGQSWRSSDRAGIEIPVHPESQGCQGARFRSAPVHPAPRRRGD